MSNIKLQLISHHLCPFVQRAVIALLEKNISFERRYVDLENKPEWFLQLSPLGKVPVLVVNEETVLFESSAIAQYVNDISGGDLLSADYLEKARQIGWVEFASQTISGIGNLYNADTNTDFDNAGNRLVEMFQRVEEVLGDGPWFANESFSLVDAAFAPAFRYFEVIENLVATDFFKTTPKVGQWRDALLSHPSVIAAVTEDYNQRLLGFLQNRHSHLGRTAQTTAAVSAAAA